MRSHFFQQLPPATAIFLLGSVFELTSAHILQLPRQTPPPTTTLPHRTFNVASWGIQATPAPLNPFDLFRRQDETTNTICGYIGGDSALPATCSAGSHCVVDTGLNVIGCCPNGAASCTSGVFTGCVDTNSGPQTEANPLIFTCPGSLLCYKNEFDGGYSQFGCGTASDLATTVKASASGATSTLSLSTIGSSTRSSSSSSSSSLSSSSSTSTSSSTRPTGPPTGPPVGAPSDRPGPPSPATDRVGPIVGGVIGGVSVVIALLAFIIFFIRRQRRNKRQGPGLLGVDTSYVSPPKSGNGSDFTPVHQSNEAYEAGLPAHQPHGPQGPPTAYAIPMSGGPMQPVWSQELNAGGPSPYAYQGAAGAHTSYPPAEGYHYPGQYPAAYAGGPVLVPAAAMAPQDKGKAVIDPEQIPLTSEGQSSQAGLGRIGEEEEDRAVGSGQPPAEGSGQAQGDNATSSETKSPSGGGRPLWQQNRRQSRTPVWM